MRKFLPFLFIVLLFVFLVGCGNTDSEDVQNNDEGTGGESGVEESGDVEAGAYPLTVTDAAGNELTLEEEPQRIVTLLPSNTEILFALDRGDKVVGVSDNDNYPEEVLELEKVGGMELNVEVIVGLEPDLVLAHELGVNYFQEALEQLEEAGITVFVVPDANSIETTYETIESIGQVVDATTEAEQLIADMKEGFAEISEITSVVSDAGRQSVFFEISPAPDIYTAGQNTFLQEFLDLSHADNAIGEMEGWPAIDPEAIIEFNPDVIMTTYGDYVDNPIEQVTSRAGFEVVDAVANERVYDIDADAGTRAGPRLVDGAREVAEAIYPELFDEQ